MSFQVFFSDDAGKLCKTHSSMSWNIYIDAVSIFYLLHLLSWCKQMLCLHIHVKWQQLIIYKKVAYSLTVRTSKMDRSKPADFNQSACNISLTTLKVLTSQRGHLKCNLYRVINTRLRMWGNLKKTLKIKR